MPYVYQNGHVNETAIIPKTPEKDIKTYWVVYMKDGQTFTFDKKGGYLETFETNMICIMTKKNEKSIAIIPTENISWIEYVEEEE